MTSKNSDQAEFWTSNAGPTWVARADQLDRLFAPVLDRILLDAALTQGQSVLDIGCGTGHAAVSAARIVGDAGHVLGADISATMIDHANARADRHPSAAFIVADAETHAFQNARFDRALSRFGIMFFADTPSAFRNIAATLKTGAQVSFATWGQIQNNPWFTMPAAVAKAELGAPPPSDPDAPGPFALRDIDKTCTMLDSAGFTSIEGHAVKLHLELAGGADELAALSLHVGPASGTIKHFEAGQSARDRIEATMRRAFAAFPGHRVPAEVNFYTAAKS